MLSTQGTRQVKNQAKIKKIVKTPYMNLKTN